MRVKILQGRAGVNVVYDAGEEYDIPDARAERWITAGFAEAFSAKTPKAPVVEKAVEPPAEVPEVEPEVETAVQPSAPEKTTKGRRK